jgi:hypothetical protein
MLRKIKDDEIEPTLRYMAPKSNEKKDPKSFEEQIGLKCLIYDQTNDTSDQNR